MVATDAPLMAHQLKRLARPRALRLARTGSIGHNGSGDIFLAFSTANEEAFTNVMQASRAFMTLPNGAMDVLFQASSRQPRRRSSNP